MTIREVHIHRAEGAGPVNQPEPVLIRIDCDMPPHSVGDGYRQRVADLFAADAKALVDAIFDTCPGGTIDALIAELLTRRSSQLRTRLPQED